jgi:hypothetical protein
MSSSQNGFTVVKSSTGAPTRKLKGEYTMELYQDLKSSHGMSADAVLSNMLSEYNEGFGESGYSVNTYWPYSVIVEHPHYTEPEYYTLAEAMVASYELMTKHHLASGKTEKAQRLQDKINKIKEVHVEDFL